MKVVDYIFVELLVTFIFNQLVFRMLSIDNSYRGDATELVCCTMCSMELMVNWSDVRDIMLAHAWVEFYAYQKEEWVMRMDNISNVTARVCIMPREGLIELTYERYRNGTPVIQVFADFIYIAHFDLFWSDITSLINRRFSTVL